MESQSWVQRLIKMVWRFFRQERQEQAGCLVLKTFQKRDVCTLSLVSSDEPRVIAAYRAVPIYTPMSKTEVWVFCQHLYNIGRSRIRKVPGATHRFTVLETPRGITPAYEQWQHSCRIIWTADFNLESPISNKNCASVVAQMIATKLIEVHHQDINWQLHAQKSVELGLKQLRALEHSSYRSSPVF